MFSVTIHLQRKNDGYDKRYCKINGLLGDDGIPRPKQSGTCKGRNTQ